MGRINSTSQRHKPVVDTVTVDLEYQATPDFFHSRIFLPFSRAVVLNLTPAATYR